MQPLNYSLGLPDPAQSFGQGMMLGEQRLAMQQQQAMALQQQQAALQAQQQREEAIRAIVSKPRPGAEDYSRLMLLMPKEHEAIKGAWGMLDKAQSQSKLADLTQWAAAVDAGRPELAADSMKRQADLIEEQRGKNGESDALRAQAQMVMADPVAAARTFLEPMIFAHPEGKAVIENLAKLRGEQREQAKAPFVQRKTEADAIESEAKAVTAGVTAKFAEPMALSELEQAGWKVKALQADVAAKRAATALAAAQAQAARVAKQGESEERQLRMQELALKVRKAESELNGATREKVAEVQGARGSIDNLISSVDEVLATPLSVKKAALGPVDSIVFTAQQDVADFETTLETLGSQVFLAQVPMMKGLGALTEAEGARLVNGLKSLSLRQSPEKLDGNMKEIQRLMLKARKTLADKYGVPDTVPDTPSAAPSSMSPKNGKAPSVDDILRDLGVIKK
jgi:hypothetical protein